MRDTGELVLSVSVRSKIMTDFIYKRFESVQSFGELAPLFDAHVDGLLDNLTHGTREHFFARVPSTLAPEGKDTFAIGFELPRDYIFDVGDELQKINVESGKYAYFEAEISDESEYEGILEKVVAIAQVYDFDKLGLEANSDDGLACLYFVKDKTKICYAVPVALKEPEPLYKDPEFEKYTKVELYNVAYHDGITGYFNWNYMWSKLDHINDYGITDYDFVHFDVKQFNMINQIYGYKKADELLIDICNLLKESKDWIYYSARCDNDRFCMLTKPLSEKELTDKLMEFFDKLSILRGTDYHVYFRCGATLCEDAKIAKGKVADFCKLAHRLGNSRNSTEINFFTKKMQEDYLYSLLLKNELPKAIENRDLVVYYQPKFSADGKRLAGAEALVRWRFKGEAMIPPSVFVPLFEKEGMIDLVDQYVLEEVCRKQREWKDLGLKVVPISVNISGVEIKRQNYANILFNIVDKYNMTPEEIEFEVTESITLGGDPIVFRFIKELTKRGYMISLDDFGTGYSSLIVLKDLPIGTVKIAKEFVDDLAKSKKAQAEKQLVLLEDMITISKHIGVYCLAEGVEDKVQAETLYSWGCDLIQGYYFSKPVPDEEYECILKEGLSVCKQRTGQ